MTAHISFEQACELARYVAVNGAIRSFAQDGEVAPVSFVLAQRDPRNGKPFATPAVLLVPLAHAAHDKDLLRVLQQSVCEESGALVHIYATEGWTVVLSDEPGIEDPYAKIASLAEHPDRIEVIAISMEHRDGNAMWCIPILRDGDKATLGEVQEQLSGNGQVMGRMTGYIKPARSMPEA